MKSLKKYIQNTSSVLILTSSTSALAHNGEHAAASTMSSIASQVTHLLSEANHMASIAVITVTGLLLVRVFRQAIQKKSQIKTYTPSPIRCDK